jgi:hypothetical protein
MHYGGATMNVNGKRISSMSPANVEQASWPPSRTRASHPAASARFVLKGDFAVNSCRRPNSP